MTVFDTDVEFQSLDIKSLEALKNSVEALIIKKQNNPDPIITPALTESQLSQQFYETWSLADLKSKLLEYLLLERAPNGAINVIWRHLPLVNIFYDTISDRRCIFIVLEDKSFTIEDEELITPAAFIKQFYKITHVMLPPPSEKFWNLFVMYLQSRAQHRINLSKVETEDIQVREALDSYLETSALTSDLEMALRYGYLLQGEVFNKPGIILVWNENISNVVKRTVDKPLSYKKIADLLKDVLIDVYVERVPGGKSKRFWGFKPKNAVKAEVVSDVETEIPKQEPINETIQVQPNGHNRLELHNHIIEIVRAGGKIGINTKTSAEQPYGALFGALGGVYGQDEINAAVKQLRDIGDIYELTPGLLKSNNYLESEGK